MKVQELYDYITKVMSPEEALKKLLSSTMLTYSKLKFDENDKPVHPEIIILNASMDRGWHIVVEDRKIKDEKIRGFLIGEPEYIDQFESKNNLIANQQLQIENYKKINKENTDLIRDITGKFVSIGQPLNDNVLMMNSKQLKWCQSVLDLVEQLNEDKLEDDE